MPLSPRFSDFVFETGHALSATPKSAVSILEEQRRSEENAKHLKEVEQQQEAFGEKHD